MATWVSNPATKTLLTAAGLIDATIAEDRAEAVRGPQGEPGADGVVQSIVAGTGITVDSTNPAAPIVSAAA